MNEVTVLVESVKTSLLEVANQASTLGNGLLHAAPGEKSEQPNPSVSYLLSTAETIYKASVELDKLTK